MIIDFQSMTAAYSNAADHRRSETLERATVLEYREVLAEDLDPGRICPEPYLRGVF